MKPKKLNLFWLLLFLPVILTLLFLMLPKRNQSQIVAVRDPDEERSNAISIAKEKFPQFELVDPEQAPEHIRKTVMLGYQIMLDTPKYAPTYVGSRLSCTHCHFAGGNTLGGKNGGISLVGSAAVYPQYNRRKERVENIEERINDCFQRSMNGKAIPLDSKEMLGLVTYLHWISSKIPIYEDVPWLGLPKLKSQHVSNSLAGEKAYKKLCALCHGSEGKGELDIQYPPLWGPEAYNEGAGMNHEPTLASFIYYNMPYGNASLTEEDAMDIASFIHTQKRPAFSEKRK